MKVKDVTLFVLDTEDNFKAPYTQDRIGKSLYKNIIRIDGREDFEREYIKEENQPFVLVCHVFHAANEEGHKHSGYARLKSSMIEEDFGVNAILVSSGDHGEVMNNIFKEEQDRRTVCGYVDILNDIRDNKLIPSNAQDISLQSGNDDFQYEFGIITALYKDEFEQTKKHFEWNKEDSIKVGTKKYWVGNLIGAPSRKVIAAIPNATGMVDSAIIATQMLELFKPKYLLMSGVCGAIDKTKFGDIVLAKKVFTFQKGKVSDIVDKKKKTIDLFDEGRNKVDYDKLYDKDGNQISISVEKFEVEHDSILEFELKDWVEPELKRIEQEINKTDVVEMSKDGISIHFEPMACSTMVINKEGFFEDHIKSVDRNTVAVEMESYSVARACQFGNEGKTKWIIFKSVMDHTAQKGDTAKKFAAYTSAQFLKHIVYDNVLD